MQGPKQRLVLDAQYASGTVLGFITKPTNQIIQQETYPQIMQKYPAQACVKLGRLSAAMDRRLKPSVDVNTIKVIIEPKRAR